MRKRLNTLSTDAGAAHSEGAGAATRKWLRAWGIATVFIGCASCGGTGVDGGIDLLRSPSISQLPTASLSGYLYETNGCLRIHDEKGLEHSLIFQGSLDVRIEDARLIVNGTEQGKIGAQGVRVELPGRTGPITYEGSTVTGPTDRACNQTDPWEVADVIVVRS